MIIFTVITNYTGVYILKNHLFVKAAEINYLKSPKLVTFHQVKPYGYTNLKKIKNTYIYIYVCIYPSLCLKNVLWVGNTIWIISSLPGTKHSTEKPKV